MKRKKNRATGQTAPVGLPVERAPQVLVDPRAPLNRAMRREITRAGGDLRAVTTYVTK